MPFGWDNIIWKGEGGQVSSKLGNVAGSLILNDPVGYKLCTIAIAPTRGYLLDKIHKEMFMF